MLQLTQTVLQVSNSFIFIAHLSNLNAIICQKYSGWNFIGECIWKHLFLFLLEKQRNTVYVQGVGFKWRNLSNVYSHVYNIWQQTGQSNFLETVFFYLLQHVLGLALLQLEVFPSILGCFYILFYFKRQDQLRVVVIITICYVFQAFLPGRIRLRIVTIKPLQNNQVVLSTS